jgi:glycosyltransferase involved in cell wall biosynthesis
MLTYDAVVITRNRPQALALSIPLIANQSRRPSKLIVVDSSEDPNAAEDVIRASAGRADLEIRLIRAGPGTSFQRNVGLRHVDADVTFFPDDDSLVLPGALESMMRVYERDTTMAIGGVCSGFEANPPTTIIQPANREYRMSQTVRAVLHRFEERFLPDPFITVARQRYALRLPPPWLSDENATLAVWMTGYRMSFRTDVIRRTGFDEALGRYALFEDADACLQVTRTQFLVRARNARIHHYRSPEARDTGRAMGVMQILNRAYVLAKHDALNEAVVRDLYRYSKYKIMRYSVAATSRWGRSRFWGALEAYRRLASFLESSNDIRNRYLELRNTLLNESEFSNRTPPFQGRSTSGRATSVLRRSSGSKPS